MKKVMLSVLLLLIITTTYSNDRVDVVGYTYYDWQSSGPPYTNLVCDTLRGIHVSWISGTPPYYTDKNIGYNYFNFTTGSWNWSNWSSNGVNVYTAHSGFNGMDVDLITGNAVLSTHQTISGSLAPVLARDQAPGAGLFEYCYGPTGYQWPPIAVTNNQAIHCVLIDCATTESLYYTRVQPWGIWSTPVNIGLPIQPGYPNHNINGSKLSNKIVVTWDAVDASPRGKYYRLSLDGGLSWQNSVSIMPPAFTPGSDTISGSWLGSFGYFDRNDNLHIVTQVYPVIGSNGYTWPAEIWHYCPVNNPAWKRVHRAEAETLSAPIGYNGIAACRPSLAQNPGTGTLYCVWEQFDALNYEPSTYLLRADIWLSESYDNGQTWHNNQRITIRDKTSKRFPIVAGTVWRDMLWVRYLIDSIAGFEVNNQGRATRNPVVVQWVPVSSGFAIEEHSSLNAQRFTLNATPNPFTSYTAIRYSLPAKSYVSLEIYDITGRLIRTLLYGTKSSGEYSLMWNGKDSKGARVKNGVYFCNLKVDNKTITQKIVMTN